LVRCYLVLGEGE
jgi:hypothetical protein